MKTFQPAVKWPGSKRHIAEEIIMRFPSKIGTYYGKSRDTTVYESLYTRGCSDCFRLEL